MPNTSPRATPTTTTATTITISKTASAATAILLLLVAVGISGCGSGARVEVAPSHPASPEAESAPIPPHSNTLAVTSTDATSSGAAQAPSATAPSGSAATYVCPMHPDVVKDRPGKCPKCGMSLRLKDKP
jgi:hypothetical protein